MSFDTAYLTGARLRLRPLRAGDADAIVAGVGNYDVSKWLAVVPFPYARHDAEAFIASPAAEPRRTWAICDDGGLCGVISIAGEFGYWLDRRAWGQGYATEAGRLVLDAAFADPTRDSLASCYMATNARSARVLDKLGFRHAGTAERMFRAYGQTAAAHLVVVTRADWRAVRGLRRRGWSSIGLFSKSPEAPR
ncbi:N-acetyltransferase [Palleronia sediminis]|uniref:N-acetyltransferase n=1 Tax=Palleronia sediminis TaxID=2547833 RepID=A0A4R6AJK4_9RHOB|nr:GNAT family N-acetyltransferase [Palleronia sediminis]TDL83525.1 N-acetyltransferase [Palleronia sediminis]